MVIHRSADEHARFVQGPQEVVGRRTPNFDQPAVEEVFLDIIDLHFLHIVKFLHDAVSNRGVGDQDSNLLSVLFPDAVNPFGRFPLTRAPPFVHFVFPNIFDISQ